MKWMVVDLASDNWYMTKEYDYRSLLFNHTYRIDNVTLSYKGMFSPVIGFYRYNYP
jgi:hypothetical protein